MTLCAWLQWELRRNFCHALWTFETELEPRGILRTRQGRWVRRLVLHRMRKFITRTAGGVARKGCRSASRAPERSRGSRQRSTAASTTSTMLAIILSAAWMLEKEESPACGSVLMGHAGPPGRPVCLDVWLSPAQAAAGSGLEPWSVGSTGQGVWMSAGHGASSAIRESRDSRTLS